MMNKVILLGRLGADPIFRENDTYKVCFLSLATNESYLKGGERVQKTLWHRISVFGVHESEYAKKYLRKGDQVLLEGKLNYKKVLQDDGQERVYSEILIAPPYGSLKLTQRPKEKGEGGQDLEEEDLKTPSEGFPSENLPVLSDDDLLKTLEK